MCNGAALARTSVQRKLGDIRSDPKADATVVNSWTKTEEQINGELTNLVCGMRIRSSLDFALMLCLPYNKVVLAKCNIGAYKTRALMIVATKDGKREESEERNLL